MNRYVLPSSWLPKLEDASSPDVYHYKKMYLPTSIVNVVLMLIYLNILQFRKKILVFENTISFSRNKLCMLILFLWIWSKHYPLLCCTIWNAHHFFSSPIPFKGEYCVIHRYFIGFKICLCTYKWLPVSKN